MTGGEADALATLRELIASLRPPDQPAFNRPTERPHEPDTVGMLPPRAARPVPRTMPFVRPTERTRVKTARRRHTELEGAEMFALAIARQFGEVLTAQQEARLRELELRHRGLMHPQRLRRCREQAAQALASLHRVSDVITIGAAGPALDDEGPQRRERRGNRSRLPAQLQLLRDVRDCHAPDSALPSPRRAVAA
jgi:hypothetical protein